MKRKTTPVYPLISRGRRMQHASDPVLSSVKKAEVFTAVEFRIQQL
jgi:hypothetical protein